MHTLSLLVPHIHMQPKFLSLDFLNASLVQNLPCIWVTNFAYPLWSLFGCLMQVININGDTHGFIGEIGNHHIITPSQKLTQKYHPYWQCYSPSGNYCPYYCLKYWYSKRTKYSVIQLESIWVGATRRFHILLSKFRCRLNQVSLDWNILLK